MRTGEQVLRQALSLLNYADTYGAAVTAGNAELLRRGMAAVEQIYADLWYQERGNVPFVPLTTPTQEILLSARVRRTVMPYGVAMLLAQSEGDGDRQSLFAALYNAKRTAVTGARAARCDVLPRGSDF